MRRRQVLSNQSKPASPAFYFPETSVMSDQVLTNETLSSEVPNRVRWAGIGSVESFVVSDKKKGFCGKCNKHIGKGVHFHEKACKG